jgi:tripartite-type tricarboxylate transporter receptor subunit TctC
MSAVYRVRFTIFTVACLTAAQFVLIGFPKNVAAQDSFYAGRTLKVIVGFPPGGGYDIYARTFVRFLPRHIPGEPAVIPVNMPGAGSLTAANYIFNVAPRDGTEIGSVETFIPFEAFFKGHGVRFDPLKFSWIGGLNSEMTTCVIWHASRIKSFEDLLVTETAFGATGSGAPPVMEPKVVNAVLRTKMRVITGYPGTADIFIAMERGEIEGACGVGWTTLISTRGDWIAQGKLRILVQNAVKRHPNLPRTPLLLDFAKTKAQKDLLTLLAAPHRAGRPYLAPPGMPAERLGILRQAFDTTTKDSDFLAEAEKLKLAINPVAGKEMEAVFAEISRMDSSLIDAMIDARTEKGRTN